MNTLVIERTEITSYGAHVLYAHLDSMQPLSLSKLPSLEHDGHTYVPFVARFMSRATADFLEKHAGYALEYRALRS